MNAICKPCARVFHMRRLVKAHACPQCGGSLHRAQIHDARHRYRVRDNPGFVVTVACSTFLLQPIKKR